MVGDSMLCSLFKLILTDILGGKRFHTYFLMKHLSISYWGATLSMAGG